jgi:hypothetical protein
LQAANAALTMEDQMTAYIISGNEIRVAARRPSKPTKGDIIITSAEDLVAARLGTKRLMAIWNALPGKKKMTKVVDRGDTIERLWAELQALPGNAAQTKNARKIAARETKQSAVIALLQRPEGATIDEIAATTGWQRHTVRGAIAGALKKRLGLLVAAAKEERGRVYRIGQDGLAA